MTDFWNHVPGQNTRTDYLNILNEIRHKNLEHVTDAEGERRSNYYEPLRIEVISAGAAQNMFEATNLADYTPNPDTIDAAQKLNELADVLGIQRIFETNPDGTIDESKLLLRCKILSDQAWQR